MAQYSIKDLENFTKIKAHTLRIWEQRYQLLSPERTETNIRFYSDKDLKKILNINLLYTNGFKISKIAQLSEGEIFEKAKEILLEKDHSSTDVVNRFVEYVLELNETAIQELLNSLADKYGVKELYPTVLIPLLEKIGTLWQVDAITVSHEHFLSNIVREFLIVSIDKLTIPKKSKAKVVLFLKEEEKHELSLLFYYYVLKEKGYDCFYLGQSVPMADLKSFVEEISPDYLFTSIIAELTENEMAEFMDSLANFFDLKNVYAGGIQVARHQKLMPKPVHQVHEYKDITL